MSRRNCVFAVAALFVDAALGIVVRNITALKEKGGKVLTDAGLTERIGMGPKEMMQVVYAFVGISAGVDEDAPAALVVANAKKAGLKRVSDSTDGLLVL